MAKKIGFIFTILLLTIIPTLLIWAPFFFRIEKFWNIPLPTNGMATIVANYDGPLYLVAAKTLYRPDLIKQIVSFPLSTQYYTAHFPLYPLLIRPFSYIFGYPYAMLLTTTLSSAIAIYYFYLLSKIYLKKKDAFWLTIVFAIFPARWLIVRSVGSAEPLFMATTIASIYYFIKKRYLPAGIFGALAQLTKPPGILLFIAYGLIIISKGIQKLGKLGSKMRFPPLVLYKFYPILIIPISLISVFIFYKIQTNDFFAYFHSGDNVHLFFPPFQIFNYSSVWVGTFWLEEVIFVYLLGVYGLIKLIQQKHTTLAYYVGVFFTSLIFVAHRDIIRYGLPIIPFLLIAYSSVLIKKEFKYIMILLIIPIYLFSLAYISQNVMPISDWAPLL